VAAAVPVVAAFLKAARRSICLTRDISFDLLFDRVWCWVRFFTGADGLADAGSMPALRWDEGSGAFSGLFVTEGGSLCLAGTVGEGFTEGTGGLTARGTSGTEAEEESWMRPPAAGPQRMEWPTEQPAAPEKARNGKDQEQGQMGDGPKPETSVQHGVPFTATSKGVPSPSRVCRYPLL